jgi:flagellar motor switch protein FliG
MSYDRTDRFRRAAILIASIDDALAEQVLAGLPGADRDRVLDVAERLEAIDPDEQRDVLAEFRRLTRGGRREAPAAVETEFSFDQSTEPRPPEPRADASPAAADAGQPAPGLSHDDAAAMAELLAAEHPQIVAAALVRLGEEQSAAVFAALPPEMQAEALERLAGFDPTDESALDEVASQLERRLHERRARQARAAAGAELVQKILARTPAAQRSILLARMAAKDPAPLRHAAASTPPPRAAVDAGLARAAAVDPIAQQALNLAAAVRRAHGGDALPKSGDDAAPIADRSAEFDGVSDEALVAALRAADETTVLRALAASGDRLLERVAGMLPRRQARQLRKMLGKLGPTRLVELNAAQHRLLDLARDAKTAVAAA